MRSKSKVSAWMDKSENGNDGDSDEEESGSEVNHRGPGANGDEENDQEEEDEDEEDEEGGELDVEDIGGRLFKLKTLQRISMLENELPITPEFASSPEALQLISILLDALTRFTDTKSHEAIVNALIKLGKKESEAEEGEKDRVWKVLVKFAYEELEKASSPAKTVATTTLFPLLTLTHSLFTTFSTSHKSSTPSTPTSPRTTTNSFPTSPFFKPLVIAVAFALDGILAPPGRKEGKERERAGVRQKVRMGGVVRTRRLVRVHYRLIPDIFSTITDALPKVGDRLVPMLGLVFGVSSRLKVLPKQSDADQELLRVRLAREQKPKLVQVLVERVLGSKTPVHSRVYAAFDDLWTVAGDRSTLVETVIPAIDKRLVSNPETALPIITHICQISTLDLSDQIPKSLIPGIISASKSSKPEIRAGAVALGKALAQRCDEVAQGKIMGEVLALPVSGKSTGPDNRIALFEIAGSIPSSSASSPAAVAGLAPLLSKEANENAAETLCSALTSHLSYCLQNDVNQPSDATLAAMKKDLASVKAGLKRQILLVLADALWVAGANDTSLSKNGEKLVELVIPSVEAHIKAGGALTTASAANALVEPYVATGLLFGVLLPKGGSNPKLKGLRATADSLMQLKPKPSYLLNEKLWRKALTEETEGKNDARLQLWLIRAVEAAIQHLQASGDKAIVLALLAPLVHAVLEGRDLSARQAAFTSFTRILRASPTSVASLMVSSLDQWLEYQTRSTGAEQSTSATALQGRSVKAVMTAALKDVQESSNGDIATAQKMMASTLLVLHHPYLDAVAPQAWIDVAVSVGLDPAIIAQDEMQAILAEIRQVLGSSASTSSHRAAALLAISTLAFVSPNFYIDELLRKATEDLDPKHLAFVGELELGVWNTPSGTLFVDVLGQKKDASLNKNSKTYNQDKWDQEVRDSIAKKKAAASGGTLSKQDQALVDSQLAQESKIRLKLESLQRSLCTSLDVIQSMLNARSEVFDRHLPEALSLVISQAVGPAAFLAGERACSLYLDLSAVCDGISSNIARFAGVALLRAQDAQGVPEDLTAESLSNQTLRVLHNVHATTSNGAISSPAFHYLSSIFSLAIANNGVGTGKEDRETVAEQLTLVAETLANLTSSMTSLNYPRLTVIRDLIAVAESQPGQAKTAVAGLVELGEAIADNATADEINVLLTGLLSGESYVRNGSLQALQPLDLTELALPLPVYVARFDEDEHNAVLADAIWEDNGLDVSEQFGVRLLPYLEHQHKVIRDAAAKAVADATAQYSGQLKAVFNALREMYIEKAKVLAPEFDRFGMVIAESLDRQDPSHIRVAIARGFQSLSPQLDKKLVTALFDFLVTEEALGDRADDAREALLAAGATVIDDHGASVISELIARFEAYLTQPASSSAEADYVKEGVIVLFGRLAKHLPLGDKRIPVIIDRLLAALETPSELVQVAVADCLPPLVNKVADQADIFSERLFETLTNGPKYAARRGAAYGLAGVVKGRGLSVLSGGDLMDRLQDASQDKKNYTSRQGAVFAYETLTATLGRVFEPYIISIIPTLLALFGDAQADVREATSDAAKVIMSKISGHCVKQILPLLLSGLEEKQWRTKKGSIELLGAMAFCAPKQLSFSLPTIIPELTGVLTDSHAQVRAAATSSLKTFGEVLNNPEIKKMQPILLKALADPTSKTNTALNALLGTSFEHYLDSPSLALVVPIIDRGLKERSSETKKKSVQIIGNMASLTESKDFIPYLAQLMPLVQMVLADPVPEARATAAKALGTLVERLGEENFPTLVTKLLQTLRSDTSGVDRQGAAQGLSEVLAGLGLSRMEGLLPDIIASASSARSYVREGFISLLVYLPSTFGQRFAPHLGRIIPPILSGLADESEYVRDASMRAGKMIIANYSNRAIELLLPELERGMLDVAWRIRQSSISLTGELLYKVTGISGKVELEEEEAPAHHAETARKALVETLGQEGRDRVLAILYIVRQDAVHVVRQASIHIWKALVHNTPKTTREILHTLIKMIIELLSSEASEQQETASRTLGELCRKSGERILGEVIPMLRSAITSPLARTREGACMAFTEMMETASQDHIEAHEKVIIEAVRVALIDENADVRSAAARAFDALQECIGAKAIDQTIPTLLEAMSTPGETSETALMALKEVMGVRAASVFPTLLPTLTVQPITAFNARAIAALVTVAGNALSKRLSQILTPLVLSVEKEKDEEVRAEVQEAIRALLSSIEDMEGMHSLQMLLLGWAKEKSPARRAAACSMFATLCQVSEIDFSDYRVDWVRQTMALFDDKDETVIDSAWSALDALVKSIPKDDLEELVVPMRRGIEAIGAPGTNVAGFSRPKGIQPVVPVLLAGLLSGTEEQKEQASLGIGELVQRTAEAALKPFIIQLTGPLIRVISSGTLPAQIKSAILLTLTILLQNVPLLVRPFHPQLTRTMIKSVSDTASLTVRNRAAAGLGELMKHQPRVDPLVTELQTMLKQSDSDIAPSVVDALAAVTRSAGGNMSAGIKEGLAGLVSESADVKVGDAYSNALGRLLAALFSHDKDVASDAWAKVLATSTPSASSLLIITQLTTLYPEALQTSSKDVAKLVQNAMNTEGLTRQGRDARDGLRGVEGFAGLV